MKYKGRDTSLNVKHNNKYGSGFVAGSNPRKVSRKEPDDWDKWLRVLKKTTTGRLLTRQDISKSFIKTVSKPKKK